MTQNIRLCVLIFQIWLSPTSFVFYITLKRFELQSTNFLPLVVKIKLLKSPILVKNHTVYIFSYLLSEFLIELVCAHVTDFFENYVIYSRHTRIFLLPLATIKSFIKKNRRFIDAAICV